MNKTAGQSAPDDEPSADQESLRDRILSERDKGNLVFFALDQMMCAPIEEFVKQPADGILYDLNRSEEISLTFIAEKKWVNDFAVALVIRKLVEQRDAALSLVSEKGASDSDIVRQLEGALVNSEGRDFTIRADFVREVIARIAALEAELAAARETLRYIAEEASSCARMETISKAESRTWSALSRTAQAALGKGEAR